VTLYTLPKRKDEESPEQFDDVLDRHVDDVLKRPSKMKRSMMGVGSFLKTPMGIITGIYGFLVVFWGAAIVIFLVKIINFHNANTQGFWIEVSSQVETGLFTLTSIGLIPYRALDTYSQSKILS
jgi:multisubunit Na+/H+ antiporter MnhB subunit